MNRDASMHEPASMHLYFAYGSNLHPLRLAERISEPSFLGVAKLSGFAMRFSKMGIDGSGKCNLHADPNSQTFGAVFEVTIEQAKLLERWEGTTCGYHRVELDVISNDNALRVFTFQASGQWVLDAPPPFDWYADFVRLGAEFHGFPSHYMEGLRDLSTQADTNAKRVQETRRIMNRMRAASRSC